MGKCFGLDKYTKQSLVLSLLPKKWALIIFYLFVKTNALNAYQEEDSSWRNQ